MADQRRSNDIVEALRQVDERLQQEGLSPAAAERLRQLIAPPASAPRVRRRPLLRAAGIGAALAGSAALLVAGAVLLVPPAPKPLPGELAGFTLVEGAPARAPQHHGIRCETARCTVAVSSQRTLLELSSATIVARRGPHIRLVRGSATLRVQRRAPGQAALKVQVSHGAIEVLGTVFSLRQRRDGGHVALHEGIIRFTSQDGRTIRLAAGQTLSWPLPPAPADAVPPTMQPPPPSPAAPPAAAGSPRPMLDARTAASLHRDISELRSRGAYRRAARMLRRNLHRIADASTRETWSYELADILIAHLRDRAAACRHWRWHLRAFGPRRYGKEITLRQREHCAPTEESP